MNYELCKELRDAGFPQKGRGISHRAPCPHDNSVAEFADRCLNKACRVATPIYIPTLSELIEACGERFVEIRSPLGNSLHYVRTLKDGFNWTAQAYDKEIDVTYGSFGSTPSEAVARLWLALQKK